MKNIIRFILVLISFQINITDSFSQDFTTTWQLSTGITSLTITPTRSGPVAYAWSQIPSGSSGSGIFVAGSGDVTISGLPSGGYIRLSIEPTNLKRFTISAAAIVSTSYIRRIENWGTAQWTSMESAFKQCVNLKITATDIPNLSFVSSMAEMFDGCQYIDSIPNAYLWNTSSVSDMSSMFNNARAFNGNISTWNTRNVSTMATMFRDAVLFNQNIGAWNTSNVIDMSYMFYSTKIFNQNIGTWNTAKVTDMSYMFFATDSFNQNIGTWNTINLNTMAAMFRSAISFNGDISTWNTINVDNMAAMFLGAISFNQNISTWNTENVTKMLLMFGSARSFNQNLSSWNTANVIDMSDMFRSAILFNQDIGQWTLNPIVNMSGMFNNSGMDCINYSSTLIGWNNNPTTPNNRNLGANGRQYTGVALAARTNLTSVKGWIISGDASYIPANILVPTGTDEVATQKCHYFNSPVTVNRKLINLDPNGNTFDYDNATVTITNQFVASIPLQVTIHSPATTGYYETASGTNCFRISRRMHTIQVPGTYSINNGIIIRIYFNAGDTLNIRTDPSPTTPINFSGWLKVALHDPQLIVNSMNTAAPELPVPAEVVFPIATGVEDGLYYADFLEESFSTFVYFASTIIPLPVTLTDWTASCSDNFVKFKWTTATELNNSYFIIESSQDAQNWNEVTQINGAGNSHSIKEYSYESYQSKQAYYRLCQIDFDKTKSYSNIIHLDCMSSLKEIVLYPNPNTGTFQMRGFKEDASITLFNISGQKLWQNIKVQPNEKIHLEHLPKGIYTILIKSKNDINFKKLAISK